MIPAIYTIPPTPTHYEVSVQFEGFLPVFGGKEGSALAEMLVRVDGLPVDPDGNPQAASEIEKLKLTLNKGVLPFTPKNIATFFPKTTISYRPSGQIVKSDAPDVKLPVRLPGLDAKRFPDITYLPIQFPEGGVEIGKPFSFTKAFAESKVIYTVTPTKSENGTISLSLKVHQEYVSYEDASRNPAVKEADRKFEVSTTVEGEGTAEFSAAEGQLIKLEMRAVASGIALDLGSKATTQRRLETVLKVKRLKN